MGACHPTREQHQRRDTQHQQWTVHREPQRNSAGTRNTLEASSTIAYDTFRYTTRIGILHLASHRNECTPHERSPRYRISRRGFVRPSFERGPERLRTPLHQRDREQRAFD